jgi:hypothetical protein
MRTKARTRTTLAVSTVGWLSIALLDLWAGVDVLTTSERGADPSPVVDHLGQDTVVDTTHLAQPDLIALIGGLLILVATLGLWLVRTETARRRTRWLLVTLALASVLVLAIGGHGYALLVPVGLLFGAGPAMLLDGRADQPQTRSAPPRTPTRRRPSPRPRVVDRRMETSDAGSV